MLVCVGVENCAANGSPKDVATTKEAAALGNDLVRRSARGCRVLGAVVVQRLTGCLPHLILLVRVTSLIFFWKLTKSG